MATTAAARVRQIGTRPARDRRQTAPPATELDLRRATKASAAAASDSSAAALPLLLRALRHAVTRAESTVQHQQLIVALVRDWVELEHAALTDLQAVVEEARQLRGARPQTRREIARIDRRVQQAAELLQESRVVFESVSDYESDDEDEEEQATDSDSDLTESS